MPSDAAGHATACFGFRHRLVKKAHSGKPGLHSYESCSVIVNDDNYPPYLEVPESQPEHVREVYPGAPDLSQIGSMIVPLPEQISLLADQFDGLVRSLLTGNQWGISKRSPILRSVFEAGELGLRIYLTTFRKLKQGLNRQQMGRPFVGTAYRLMPLPHFVWVCELHDVRNQWSARCLGEIMWDATCNRHEEQGLQALHYPEVLVINSLPVFENRVAPSIPAHALDGNSIAGAGIPGILPGPRKFGQYFTCLNY